MKRPLILVTTGDRQFEADALAAVHQTGHNGARAADLPETWRLYTADLKKIALVIFDLDVDEHSMSFLRLLARSKPQFAILAVSSKADTMFDDDAIQGAIFDHLAKPLSQDEIRKMILKLCEECELSGREALARW
ncbi:hypothetical protein BH09VER1_BH09VER1_52240 [soil metagenome]